MRKRYILEGVKLAMDSIWTKQGKIQFLNIQSHTCMEKAVIFQNQGLYKQSIKSTDKAIRSMFTACYMQEKGTSALQDQISIEELFSIVRHHYQLDLNGELLLSAACFLAEHYDLIIVREPSKEQISRMLQKIKQLLEHLSRLLYKEENPIGEDDGIAKVLHLNSNSSHSFLRLLT